MKQINVICIICSLVDDSLIHPSLLRYVSIYVRTKRFNSKVRWQSRYYI